MIKSKKEILNIETLEMFERLINRDQKSYALDMMVMPGTLEDKHKNCETIPALRRHFNLIYLFLEGEHDVKLGADHLQLNLNDLVIVPENMLYASDHIKNCKGYCIHFKSESLTSIRMRAKLYRRHLKILLRNTSVLLQRKTLCFAISFSFYYLGYGKFTELM
jgi:hypothetical protein